MDCENVVVYNRAGWDENQSRMQGSSLSTTSAAGDEQERTLGTGLRMRTRQSIKHSNVQHILVVLKLKYSFACLNQ